MLAFRFKTLDQAASALAEQISADGNRCVQQKGWFSLVLSGGNTPIALFNILAEEYADQSFWPHTSFFWADERCVPRTSAESNFHLADLHLLQKLGIESSQIYPMYREDLQEDASAHYAKEIVRYFSRHQRPFHNSSGFPSFDVILLGMGADGHTASLFPDHQALVSQDIVTRVHYDAATPPVPRLTLTPPVIKNGAKVYFLAAGKDKLQIFDEIETRLPSQSFKYPAELVGRGENCCWYLAE